MSDDIECLAENEPLLQLLQHYADAGAADRTAWQNRVAEMDGQESKDLIKLHGLLIAFGWVDQNTGAIGCGYRATSAGFRALRQVVSARSDDAPDQQEDSIENGVASDATAAPADTAEVGSI